jgi:hypothetical protein
MILTTLNTSPQLDKMPFLSGPQTESCSTNEKNITPHERKRRQDHARWATMRPVCRVLHNKKKRDSYVSKRLFKTPQQSVERRQQKTKTIRRELRNNLRTTCILTPSPRQTLNGSHSFYSLLAISLPREYWNRW